MTSVIVTSAAEKDFTDSLCWYAKQSLAIAEDFDREFGRVVQELHHDPERFPLSDEKHRFVIIQRFPFQVIFRRDGTKVVIIALAHASRSPNYWSDR
ncbi:type II toxin-antitoxin system RelE/ParE family toxin [Planctomycetaceae bacterium]|nr:type II toxin-antitoxin system RelE/ParE family toxin [Planctomycetaceae bacterium]